MVFDSADNVEFVTELRKAYVATLNCHYRVVPVCCKIQLTDFYRAMSQQMQNAVFPSTSPATNGATADWPASVTSVWGRQPVRVAHQLHNSPLFSRNRLAQLVEHYPREHYSIIQMGAQANPETDAETNASEISGQSSRQWDEGDIRNLSGEQILQSIERGRFWLNLRYTNDVDPEFRELQDQILSELRERLPVTEHMSNPTLGVLISSPNAQVYYHCDLPNQSLWQISGSKSVYVYPAAEPFLSGEDLERIAIYELEVDLAYDPWFDDFAVKFDFQPGQMLHWPLNAPHRIENHNCLNVSVTTEYWTQKALLNQRLNMANGTLRYRLGMTPKSRSTSGAGFFTKSVVQALLSRTGWLEKARTSNKPLEFALDSAQLGQTRALADAPGASVGAK